MLNLAYSTDSSQAPFEDLKFVPRKASQNENVEKIVTSLYGARYLGFDNNEVDSAVLDYDLLQDIIDSIRDPLIDKLLKNQMTPEEEGILEFLKDFEGFMDSERFPKPRRDSDVERAIALAKLLKARD